MNRVFQHQKFLFKIPSLKKEERKQAFLTCSVSELEAIVEIIINLKTLNILDQCGPVAQTLFADFNKQETLSVSQIRNFLTGNLSLIKSVIDLALVRILEEWILCGFDNDSATALDE